MQLPRRDFLRIASALAIAPAVAAKLFSPTARAAAAGAAPPSVPIYATQITYCFRAPENTDIPQRLYDVLPCTNQHAFMGCPPGSLALTGSKGKLVFDEQEGARLWEVDLVFVQPINMSLATLNQVDLRPFVEPMRYQYSTVECVKLT